MSKSAEIGIGIAAAIGILLANTWNPWASALLALAALAWLIPHSRRYGIKRGLAIAAAALVVAAAVSFLMR